MRASKPAQYELAVESGDALAALIQNYDWADEVLHAYIGREWFVRPYGDAKKAVEYGDASWSKIVIDWSSYKAKGLTQHENWWPKLYEEWCAANGKNPDPEVLAYSTSYAASRADLKDVSVSA